MYDLLPSKLHHYMDLENTSAACVKNWVFEHSPNRSEVFRLVSHDNPGGPCLTIRGRPCVFPFIHPDCSTHPSPPICNSSATIVPTLHTKCPPKNWCSTKTHWNNSHIAGEYGLCSPRCASKVLPTENLASSEFPGLWKGRIFSLVNDSLCFTYKPSHQTTAGHQAKFLAYLGRLYMGHGDVIALYSLQA